MADKGGKKAATSSRVSEARQAIATARASLDAAKGALDEVVVVLDAVERQTSSGRLRVGESSVLRAVLAAAEKRPALVAGHTDADGGVDPARFEAELLREWIDLYDVFAAATSDFETRVAAITGRLSDTALHYGAKARRPALRAYRDLAQLAESNAQLRKDLAEPIAYYGDVARKGARTRAKKKA